MAVFNSWNPEYRCQLPDEVYEQLKCSKCGNYLSVGPITSTSEGDFCGRCSKNFDVRNTIFEKLSQHIKFPCKFKKHGCQFYEIFNKIATHEGECVFKTMLCPALSCDEMVTLKGVVKHVEENHKQLIMKSLISIKCGKTNYFILRSSKMFVFHTDFCEEKGLVALSSLSNANSTNSNTFSLVTEAIDNNNLVRRDYQFNQYTTKIKPEDQMIPICVNTIKSFLDTDDILFDVQIFKEEKEVQDDKLLKQLECPVCFTTMSAPIFVCNTGHSICGGCKPKLEVCPTCKKYWSNARNYTLEKIAESFLVSKCRYTGFPNAGAIDFPNQAATSIFKFNGK